MKTTNIGTRLTVETSLLAALAICMAAASFYFVGKLGAELEKANTVGAYKVQLIGTEYALTERLAGMQTAALLEGRGAHARTKQQEIQTAASELSTIVTEIKRLAVTAAGQKSLGEFLTSIERWNSANGRIFGLLAQGQVEAAAAVNESEVKPIVDSLRKAARQHFEMQKGVLAASTQQARSDASQSRWITLAFLAVAVLVGGRTVALVRTSMRSLRSVCARVTESAAQVAEASKQVSSASQSMAQGATEQAAAVEQSLAAANETAASAEANLKSASAAKTVMHDAVGFVENGNRKISEMAAAITAIEASSTKVARINKVIDEIAFQTNILALNAAVEAARAGAAGAGFAVVADEVRNLARRSAEAAQETAALIEEAVARSRDGGAGMAGMVDVMQQITTSASSAASLVDEILACEEEQSERTRSIGRGLGTVEATAQTAAANAEETAAASEELAAQSQEMRSAADFLEALVGHDRR